MKKKMQKIILCIGILAALFVSAFFVSTCDMVGIDKSNGFGKDLGSDSREISAEERDELEKNGHFLKIVNMPVNTQVPNVFSVSVANSASAIAKLNSKNIIYIFRETNPKGEKVSSTVYLPLVYNNDSEFIETGSFYTAFTIHVDALVKYIVDISEQFIVSYTDGRGTADVNKLPTYSNFSPEPRYLTIFNLPSSVSVYNFSGVSVRNQVGDVAKCKDYSQIVLSVKDNFATAKIPLHYNSVDKLFTETGVFYVLFDINVDIETRYTLTLDDQVKVSFINGNGFLDILNIPDKPIPYLIIKELPLTATKQQLSSVSVYNSANTVATCVDYKTISVLKDDNYTTFLIPLTSSSGDYFNNTGRFGVSFTIYVDYETQYIFTNEDKLILPFYNGSAEFGIESFFGYFKASLVNSDLNDTGSPIIAVDSSFDVNGTLVNIDHNLHFDDLTPSTSGMIYLYAFNMDGEVFYEFSSTKPKYNQKKKGWYNGNKRALWKMVYIRSTNYFIFKTYIEDNFPQFETYSFNINQETDYNPIVSGKTLSKSIDGNSNLPAENFSLDPGLYFVTLKGGGGGNGSMGGGAGGQGGIIRELVSLNEKTTFTGFTGSGGKTASSCSPSGNFVIVTTSNSIVYTYTHFTNSGSSGPGSGDRISAVSCSYSNDYIDGNITVSGVSSSSAGGAGGGGGSGTFLLSSSSLGNYFLVAGGGGGGSGGSWISPGGGGGSGGTIGPGGSGGASGWLSTSDSLNKFSWNSSSCSGGAGGGYGGTDYNPISFYSTTSTISGGGGAGSYSSGNFSISAPLLTHYEIGSITFNKNSSNPTFVSSSLGNPVTVTSSYPSFSVRTSYSFTNASAGSGTTYFPSGNYISSNNAVARGGSAPALSGVSVSGRTVSIGGRKDGNAGEKGGNNRNNDKGYGTNAAEAGSITVYKID